MPSIKFYKGASSPSNADNGSIWFDSSKGVINLKDTNWVQYGLGNNNLYEANLQWGGKNLAGEYGPVDAALIPSLGANRLAFLPAECIDVEYSRDGGATWTDYGSSDVNKTAFFTQGLGADLFIGGKAETGVDKSTHQLRITIKNTKGKIYTEFRKFAIRISTNGSQNCWCTIQGRLQTNVEADTDTWNTFVDKQQIAGWSGWNIIQTRFTTYGYSGSKSYQYGNVRFTFGCESHNQTYSGLIIYNTLGFGGVGWDTSSNLAKTGTLYGMYADQSAVFPTNIKANGTITGSVVYSEGYKAAKTGSSNNLVNYGNEINLVDGLTMNDNEIWFNCRNSNTKINYVYIGNGRAGQEDVGNNVATVVAEGYRTKNPDASKVLTSDGGTKDISTLQVESANKLIWTEYEE